jgi:hypothetical protein
MNTFQPAAPGAVTPAPPAPQPGQVRKHLTLTKEQMFEAQEMFRTANKVTRPEKALILGFMAGSRDNPCPHLGNFFSKFPKSFLAASTECSAGSNDHFVVGGVGGRFHL